MLNLYYIYLLLSYVKKASFNYIPAKRSGQGDGGSKGCEDQQQRRDNAITRGRDDANNANDESDREGGGGRTTHLPGQWRGVLLPASALPDGRHGARLCPATTAPHSLRDDDDGR